MNFPVTPGFWRSYCEQRIHLLALVLVVILGNFFYMTQFGFYEDDYWAVVPFLDAKGKVIFDLFKDAFTTWPQGRPLNHFLPMLFSWLGFKTGHIWGIYALCAVVIVANTLLLYQLLKKLLGKTPALIGALFFALYPADTTRTFIVHAAHLQTGLTLCLSGLLLFQLGGWQRWLAYPIAGISLLAYETTFLPFVIAAPFLIFLENKPRSWWLVVRHFFCCGLVLATIAAIRIGTGESRAGAALGNMHETIWKMFSSLWIGPMTSVKAVLIALTHPKIFTWWEGLVIAFCAVIVFLLVKGKPAEPANAGRVTKETLGFVFIGGICIWIGSYVLCIINYPPDMLGGRGTSVHMAGALGAALAFSSGCTFLLQISDRMWIRRTIGGCLACFFALLMANGLDIQRDYIAAWNAEKTFWKGVLKIAPDLQSDDLIILFGRKPLQPRAIQASSWADTLMPAEILKFKGEDVKLLAIWVRKTSSETFTKRDDTILVRPRAWMPDEQIEFNPEKAILIESTRKGYRRRPNLILDNGITVQGRLLEKTGLPNHRRLTKFGKLLLEPSQ